MANPDPSVYLGDNYVVLDFETEVNDGRYGSAIDQRNHLALACWRSPVGTLNAHWGSEFDQHSLAEAIKNADFLVAHNAKYELGWLIRCGVDIGNVLCFDTKLAEYVLLGNRAAPDKHTGLAPISTSLDACCVRRDWQPKDPIVDIWMRNGIKVSDMPAKWVEDRCKLDVLSTHTLFLEQRERLYRTKRLPVLYTRAILTPVLADIEREGVHLDKSRVRETTELHRKQLRELESEFTSITGGINFRSPQQVAGYLYDTLGFDEPRGRDGQPKRTATGKRAAGKKVLDKLAAKTDAQRRFLALKATIGKVAAALSKNLEYFQEICDVSDGTFHAEFNQTITATHRLSSTGIKTDGGQRSVQLTNIPRDFKHLFTAKRDGWLIGEADGAQLEFRVAAHLGDDKQAKRDIGDPTFDAHCVTAAAMSGKDYETIRQAYKARETWASKLRQEAKPVTFQPLYGGRGSTKASQAWAEEFRNRYSDLARVQEDWVYEVLASGRLVTPWGLRYYFPRAKISSTGYCNVGTAIYNYPVQALATAEIIPISLAYFWHTIRAQKLGDYIVPVNTIHDSLVCEVHPDYADKFREVACEAFGVRTYDYLRNVYHLEYSVPLGIGLKLASHWSEGNEELYQYFNGKTERLK
jgi:DNA polymerase I-like protein with 3'-5' exonuclease and polymerase domains